MKVLRLAVCWYKRIFFLLWNGTHDYKERKQLGEQIFFELEVGHVEKQYWIKKVEIGNLYRDYYVVVTANSHDLYIINATTVL
jgi:hypothetical protein